MVKDFEELHKQEEALRQEANGIYDEFEDLTDIEKVKLKWIAEAFKLARPIYDGTLPTQ